MSQKRWVRVCDDNGTRASNWAKDIMRIQQVSSQYEVDPLPVADFADAFEALKERQREARRSDEPNDKSPLRKLDEADIVVSDFDLTPADGEADLDPDTLKTLSGSFGDVFAYLLRHFTDAAYTVLANQAFYQSTFDLSHMRFATSNADLNVAGDDLRRPELWTGVSDGTTYRPWHWPRLLDAAAQRRSLAESLDLDAPVLETLGLDDQATVEQFTSEQLEFLGPDPARVTFADATAAAGKFGRSTEHERIPDRYRAQAAVAIVCHWLERIVMPGQNVTIDAPHLAQRRPGVMTSRDPEDWAALCDLSKPSEVRERFDESVVGAAVISELQDWTSRPVWAWHRIPRNVPRVSSGGTSVFCEDVSAFHPIDEAWEYESSVPSPFNQRFVLYENVITDGVDIDYWPQRRLFG